MNEENQQLFVNLIEQMKENNRIMAEALTKLSSSLSRILELSECEHDCEAGHGPDVSCTHPSHDNDPEPNE